MYSYYEEPSFFDQVLMAVGGYPMIILFVVLFIMFSAMSRRGKGSLNAPMSILVLREFFMNNVDDESDDTLVYMEGRPSGLLNWLLTITGLGATTFLSVKRTELSFRSASLRGSFYSLMSLKNISSVHCGFYRPIGYLIAAVFCFILMIVFFAGDISGAAVLCLIIGVLFLLGYHFNKLIRVMVQTNGGSTFGMCFKPSLIEGVNVNMDKAQECVELINRQIMAVQNKD